MREEYMSSQEIMQEIADLKIKLALQQEFEQEVSTILEQTNMIDEGQTQPVQDMETKVLRDIADHMRPTAHLHGHTLPKGLRVFAVALLLVIVSISSAFATVHMIQIGLLKLDMQTYQERTSYGLQPSGETLDVPAEWKGSFYPTYIPESFVLYDCTSYDVEYRTRNDETLLNFSEYEYGGRVSLDTENAEISTTQINGIEATLIEKDGWVAVVWAANNRLFVIDMDGNIEEILKVAESVTMIP